ncbi:MAG: hypothetical protein KH386_14090 [Bacteroides sp.]|nr:hypothetical protein [Bacteroides sp.]
MKKIVRILILCLSYIVACGLLPACSSAIEEPESGGGSDGSTVTLTIQAAVPDGTRADGSEVPDREKIDQLRIIVVDQTTHKVEHNQLHGFSYPEDEYNIEVEKNSTKDVYFLANAEIWYSDFPKVGEIYNPDEDESEGNEGDDGIIEARTTTMPSLFNQEITDLPENLPYTSKYEIKVADKNVAATCYIAIAAVKFSFTFTNGTGNDIVVSDFKISSIADRSYLFPHNKDWDEWVENVTGDGAKEYFTKYEIPFRTTHNVFPVPIPSSGNEGESEAGTGTSTSSFTVPTGDNNTYLIPDFYCHESKHILPFPDAKDQQYFIQFTIGGKEYVAEIQGLKSLIRSTHVIVNIKINNLSEDEPREIVVWGKITDWKDLDPVEGGLEEVAP